MSAGKAAPERATQVETLQSTYLGYSSKVMEHLSLALLVLLFEIMLFFLFGVMIRPGEILIDRPYPPVIEKQIEMPRVLPIKHPEAAKQIASGLPQR